MRMKQTISILICSLLVLTAGPLLAAQSASYNVILYSAGSGSGNISSVSYTAPGKLGWRKAGTISSASYSTPQGFFPAVFQGPLGPVITSIDPGQGYNIAPLSIKNISGGNFAEGAAVALRRSGESDIAAYNVSVISATELSCEFDLAGQAIGLWDVVITNPDDHYAVLPSGFEVKTYPFVSSLAVNSPNPFDPGRESTTLMYKLEQDRDVNLYIFTTTADLVWKRSYNAGAAGGSAGDNSVIWDGVNDFSEVASNGVYLLHVIDRSSGKTLARGKIAVLRR